MKYRVYQSFETLGDPAMREFERRDEADEYEADLKRWVANEVASWPTPNEKPRPMGFLIESDAWAEAAKIAGVEYNETGERIAGPEIYGRLAGRFVSVMAVKVEEIS